MAGFDLTEDQVIERWTGYTDAFSRQDHAGLTEYLAEDLHFVRGDGMEPWRSRQELFDFHGPKACWQYFDERLRPLDVEFLHLPAPGSDFELCYFVGTLEIHVEVFQDWADPPYGYPPMRAGETMWMKDRVIYTMNAAGKIVAIMWIETEFSDAPFEGALSTATPSPI